MALWFFRVQGVDFDIENYATTANVITNLVARVKFGRSKWPNLVWMFTLATGGKYEQQNLNSLGNQVVNAIKNQGLGWDKVVINLMTMVGVKRAT